MDEILHHFKPTVIPVTSGALRWCKNCSITSSSVCCSGDGCAACVCHSTAIGAPAAVAVVYVVLVVAVAAVEQAVALVLFVVVIMAVVMIIVVVAPSGVLKVIVITTIWGQYIRWCELSSIHSTSTSDKYCMKKSRNQTVTAGWVHV